MHFSLYGAGYHCLPLGPAASPFRVVIGNIEKPREYADELGLRNEGIFKETLKQQKSVVHAKISTPPMVAVG